MTSRLSKKPPQVRIASREELKLEVQKYKNAYLNLQQAWKKTGQKVPSFAKQSGLEKVEDGWRPDDKQRDLALDHLETQSNADSHITVPNDFNPNDASPDDLHNQISKLEEVVSVRNQELQQKNNKLLDLMQNLEDMKIEIYSRDKTIQIMEN